MTNEAPERLETEWAKPTWAHAHLTGHVFLACTDSDNATVAKFVMVVKNPLFYSHLHLTQDSTNANAYPKQLAQTV